MTPDSLEALRAEALVARMRRAGLRVRLDGEVIKVAGSPDVYASSFRDLVAATRPHVLTALAREAAGVGVVERAESPIEAMLAREILEICADGIVLLAQHKVGHYRLDLALLHGESGAHLAIECDGHEFHSSPEAMARDRSRDRDLLVLGWRTARYTGREIHNDVRRCAEEVLRILGTKT